MPETITVMTPADSASLRRLARTDAALTKATANEIFAAQATPQDIIDVYHAVLEGARDGDGRLVNIYLDRILGPVAHDVNVSHMNINQLIDQALFGDDD